MCDNQHPNSSNNDQGVHLVSRLKHSIKGKTVKPHWVVVPYPNAALQPGSMFRVFVSFSDAIPLKTSHWLLLLARLAVL